jgi:hypothetical protein
VNELDHLIAFVNDFEGGVLHHDQSLRVGQSVSQHRRLGKQADKQAKEKKETDSASISAFSFDIFFFVDEREVDTADVFEGTGC